MLDALGVENYLNYPNADSKYNSEAAFFIDRIWQIMTSDQIAEAQKMAREMVEANTKLMGE